MWLLIFETQLSNQINSCVDMHQTKKVLGVRSTNYGGNNQCTRFFVSTPLQWLHATNVG